MERAVLTTGGNIGDREQNLDRARRMIAERAGRVVARSSVRESAPWGDMDGDAGMFLNQALVIETKLDPPALLEVLQGIEKELGRERPDEACHGGARKYLSRTMDIDIIFYGNQAVKYGGLTVPHPLVADREFVLALLAEIIPEYIHPLNGMTVTDMLEKVKYL